MVDILQQFARAGVEVRLDPRIESTVTGAVRGKDLDESLEDLLASYDYLLTWKMLRGPLGRIPKLKQIEIFMPGSAATAQPVPHQPPVFEATRGVTGTAPEFVKDELLLRVRPGVTYEQFKRLLDAVGGMIVDADVQTGVYLIRFPPGTNVEALLEQLARNALVNRAELNHVVRLPDATPIGSTNLPPLPDIPAPASDAAALAVLDSGLDPLAGLSNVIIAAWDAVDPGRTISDPEGHGTQMAFLASGLIAAEGVAKSGGPVPIVAIRTFDEEGKTSNFAILQALSYAAKAGAKVVNMSWGSEKDSEFMRDAMRKAAARGLILVAAAGNEPHGKSVYPAAYPEVIAVSGVRADNQPWSNANRGSFIELSAPAFATLPVGHNGPPGTYVGTSISSVVVANALAVYLSRVPGATAASTRAALRQALSPAPAGGYGAGVLDADALRRFLNP